MQVQSKQKYFLSLRNMQFFDVLVVANVLVAFKLPMRKT